MAQKTPDSKGWNSGVSTQVGLSKMLAGVGLRRWSPRSKAPATYDGAHSIALLHSEQSQGQVLLSLRELACSSCLFETVLLSFLHSGVSCQESSSLQGWSVSFSVSFAESSGNSVSQCSGLTSVTAAVYRSDYVELAFASSDFKRSLNLSLYDFLGKVVVERLLVYCDISVTRD